MADEQDTSEVASIKSLIESLLDANQDRIEIDLSKYPISFNRINNTSFTGGEGQISIGLGFQDENLTKNSSLDQFRSSFDYIALNRLPVPGLEGVPPQWEIYPQTPISSFSEGVTFDQYDPKTQILQLTIETSFFAIFGSIPQKHPIADRAAPKGTYLQVRRDIQGLIKLRARLVFN